MSRGIIIFGSAGAGKTTLGKLVAELLNFPYYDLDDFIWRNDTKEPFTVMYSRAEKAQRLMDAITTHEHFVMAGSMDSFHAQFDPLFDLAVHLTAPVKTRVERITRRAHDTYGERIDKGGDMYATHRRFLFSASRYDFDGSPCLKTHSLWADSLPCKVLRLDGEAALSENASVIVAEYLKAISAEK